MNEKSLIQLIDNGILSENIQQEIISYSEILHNLQLQCCHNNGNIIDNVFKAYLIYRNIEDVKSVTRLNDVINILIYRYASNNNLSLYAKLLYCSKTGKKQGYKLLLQWQIQRLKDNAYSGNDLKEYKTYLNHIGEDDGAIPAVFAEVK